MVAGAPGAYLLPVDGSGEMTMGSNARRPSGRLHRPGAGSARGWEAYREAVLLGRSEPLARAVTELCTPIQFLDVNLGFLRTSHERLSTLLELHRAFLRQHPAGGDALRAADADPEVAFFATETPRALAESATGLATVSRLVVELKKLARGDDRSEDEGEVEASSGGGSHAS
jgi:hypothetical protein